MKFVNTSASHMKTETLAILEQMGFIPFDTTPDRDDGTVTWFIPDAQHRPRFSVKLFPTTTPVGLMQAIWRAGAEEKKQEIAKAHGAFLDFLA